MSTTFIAFLQLNIPLKFREATSTWNVLKIQEVLIEIILKRFYWNTTKKNNENFVFFLLKSIFWKNTSCQRFCNNYLQKQPSGVIKKRCSENMKQIYMRTPMLKWDFNKVIKQGNFIEVTLRHRCSHVNLLHIFRTPLPKNTSGRLFL